MTLTIVKGVVGKVLTDQGSSSGQARQNSSSSSVQNQVASATASSTGSSDAVSYVRNRTALTEGSKVKSFDKAEKLSEEIAEGIGENTERSLGVHGKLSSNSASDFLL